MRDFLEEVMSGAKEYRRAIARKVRWMILIAMVLAVALFAFGIVLSKVLPMLLLATGIIGLSAWVLIHVKKGAVAKFIVYTREVLEKLIKLLKEKEEELGGLNNNPADYSLAQLLTQANDDERTTLEKFVSKSFESSEQFERTIRKKATHDISYYLDRIKGVEEKFALASYSEMLDITGEKLEVKRDSRNDCDYEQALVKTAFKKMVGSMQEKDRKLLEHEMNKYADKHLGDNHMGIALSSGGLVLANIGGFTTYTMSMSLLAGASATLGIGLPFAAYTSFASVLSVAIGPAGWAAIGLWSAHRMASADKKVTPLVVLAVASIRARLIYEQENRKEELAKEISEYIRQKEQLSEILYQVERSADLKSIYAAIEQAPTQAAIEVDEK